jgi:hypothetical protein
MRVHIRVLEGRATLHEIVGKKELSPLQLARIDNNYDVLAVAEVLEKLTGLRFHIDIDSNERKGLIS